MRNTKSDFIATLDGNEPITCPACGGQMNMQNPATYATVLTLNARSVANQILDAYRRWLGDIEIRLQTANLYGVEKQVGPNDYPYRRFDLLDERGAYKTDGAARINLTLTIFDQMELHKFLAAFPKLTEFEQAFQKARNVADIKLPDGSDLKPSFHRIRSAIQLLCFGLEPHEIAGELCTLIFKQEDVHEWMDRLKLGDCSFSTSTKLNGLNSLLFVETMNVIRESAGTLSRYITLTLEALEDSPGALANLMTANQAQTDGDADFDPNRLKQQLVRTLHIIAVLLGHERVPASAKTVTPEHDGQAPQTRFNDVIEFIKRSNPYDLPQNTTVDGDMVKSIFSGKIFVSKSDFKWSRDFLSKITSKEKLSNSGPRGGVGEGETRETLSEYLKAAINEFGFLKSDIGNLFDFRCKGSPAARPRIERLAADIKPPMTGHNDAATSDRNEAAAGEAEGNDLNDSELNASDFTNRYCGWRPRDEPTLSVILFGSPGSSKSTVMMSGMTVFAMEATQLGISIRSKESEDVDLINYYTKQFYNGAFPSATLEGQRFSIQLVAALLNDPNKRANFVFSDIAGERVSRSLAKQGTDPTLLNQLRAAKVIVLFFDLASEDTFFNPLSKGRNSKEWGRLIKDVNDQRIVKRCQTNQFFLLGKLLEDMREVRSESEEKPFIVCVIPKSDYYAGAEPSRFLNSFFDDMENAKLLGESQLIQNPASDQEGNKYTKLQSRAGQSADAKSVLGEPKPGWWEDDPVQRQLKIARFITDRARDAFKGIGSVFGAAASEDDKAGLVSKIEDGLFRMLEKTIGTDRLFILPVSAQGQSLKQSNPLVGAKTNAPPPQKFSEYVFLIPAAIALKELGERVKKVL